MFIWLKCPYCAFSKITFHAVCNIAVCECKMSAKFQRWKCVIKVLFSLKRNRLWTAWNEYSAIPLLLAAQTYKRFVTNLHNAGLGSSLAARTQCLIWPSNTVVAQTVTCRHCFQCWESRSTTCNSRGWGLSKTDTIVTVCITVYQAVRKIRSWNSNMVMTISFWCALQ